MREEVKKGMHDIIKWNRSFTNFWAHNAQTIRWRLKCRQTHFSCDDSTKENKKKSIKNKAWIEKSRRKSAGEKSFDVIEWKINL